MTDTQERLVDPSISVDDFVAEARVWFDEHAVRRPTSEAERGWGEGEFDVSVFSDMSFEDERDHILRIAKWIQTKATRGYHAVAWPVEYGGLGLSRAHARALGHVEREYESPGSHELISVTVGLIASTLRVVGSDELKTRFVKSLLSCRDPGVSAVQRTRRRVRPRRVVVPGRSRRRRVGRQRPEGVELGRPVQPVGRAHRAHRPRRDQAPGSDGVHAPARCARRGGATDQADERRLVVLRGVLQRRPDPRRPPSSAMSATVGRSRPRRSASSATTPSRAAAGERRAARSSSCSRPRGWLGSPMIR